ncbi:galactokinase [Nocardioides sp.]|uniref:galactokinase n=1 Tax=Nocardioides sp. TaxID=35761 RepID=UPI002D80FF48|nr:galactokinase [Nocardioides sp.]HET8961561.1 galactokinase [Nocardioides sp.]
MDFNPAAIGRAPGRVNLIGEHTDYNAGLCLPLALPRAASAAVAPRPDGSLDLRSESFEDPWRGNVEDLAPGTVSGWAGYVTGVLWALRQSGLDVPGLDVRVDSDVPIGAGLSSSAALECAVAVAVAGLLDLPLSEKVRTRLAHVCVRAETEYVGAPTGGMDQTVAMLATEGSALLIDFDDDTTRDVPLPLAEEGLTLVVTDTGVTHDHATGGYAERRQECEAAARALGVASLRRASPADLDGLDDEVLRRRARHVVTENARVTDAVDAIGRRDWPALGLLLDASHLSLRDEFEVSCPELDLAVVTAREAGALGARMTGGGFGGSVVSLVPEERASAVTTALDVAFAAAGLAAPAHLTATASGGASAG